MTIVVSAIILLQRGGDSSINSTNSTTWGQFNSLSWGTNNITSSNGWGTMKNNDAIQNLKEERDSIAKIHTREITEMQEKYDKLLKSSKIQYDQINETYTKTKSVAKMKEDQCSVITNKKQDLESNLNNVVKENDLMKKNCTGKG